MPLERFHQPAEHERQRLEAVNRPLEFKGLLEPFFRHGWHEGQRILSSGNALPPDTRVPKPRRSGTRMSGDRLRIDHATFTGAS